MNFRTVKLGEVTYNYDSLRRPVKSTERVAGEFPYYGASGIVDYVDNFILDGEYLLIAEDGENLRSRTTPIAFMATGKFWVNNHAHVVRGNELADTRFLSYILANTDVSGYLTGSTQPKLTRAAMDSIQLIIPELRAQQAIVELLGALDDKIAANVKLASVSDEFLAAKFSALAQHNSKEVPLGTIARVNAESIKPVPGGRLRYIDISAVDVGVYSFPEVSAWEDAPSRARRKVSKGDTIWSTVRPNRRSHALNLSDDPLLVGSTGLAVLSPVNVGFAYLYEVTRLPQFTAYLENVAEGSAYPAVRADRFASAPIPMLADEVKEAFESLAAPLRGYAHSLIEENITLASIRDALLPQLMSGKLRIKDLEAVVEEVA